MLAPDLRGRGASNSLPGPFGLTNHALDCARILDTLGGRPAVVVGESMGGYVAVLLAAARPDLVSRLVLVDGGIPLPLPEGVDPEALAQAVLGPALSRLSMVFESKEAYLDFWRAHPAVGEDWNEYVEAYLDYDLCPAEGGYRSRVSEEAVRADSTRTLLDAGAIDTALASLRCPIHLVRAPRNLVNEPTPLIPPAALEAWRARLPRFSDEVVEDTNHYTLMFGARGAAVIAARVMEAD